MNTCARVRAHSVVSDSVTPWTVARQAPLSMGFSRQEYWSGLPCPPPGNLPNPGIESASPGLPADSLLLSHEGSPMKTYLATGHLILKNTSPYKRKAAVQSQLPPTAFSVYEILQARILEWVAMPSSRESSQPRDPTHISYVSCIGRWVPYH